jgi:hypothetical protein
VHGPIEDGLAEYLKKLHCDERVKLRHSPVNLGIVGGMRACLEAASGDYIVPLDADDLVASNALATLGRYIVAERDPILVYSDEDILVGDRTHSPYRRPDWDPVLNAASSYIWHLTAIRRDAALSLGLFEDPGAEFCHDWDTVFRVAAAAVRPVHAPHILYHWRQHPASSTNRPDPDSGSRKSTRHVLQRFVNSLPRPHDFLVEEFPIFRGAPEWHIARRPNSIPRVGVVCIGGDADRLGEAPFAARAELPPDADSATVLSAAMELDVDHVCFISEALRPSGAVWFWEAVKLFEIHPEAALVQGLIVDRLDRIVRGGEIYLSDGRIACPQFNRAADDPGPFAIALKPHRIAAAVTDFFFAELRFLRECRYRASSADGVSGLGVELGALAENAGRIIAFSPLICARTVGPLLDRSLDVLSANLSPLARECAQRQGILSSVGFFDADRYPVGN